jgi:hypothetical protein
MKNFWSFALVALSLAGCSSFRTENKSAELLAKQFQLLPGKAALYVYYHESDTVSRSPVQLFLSRGGSFEATHRAKAWARLPPASFARVDLEPGPHGIVALYMPAGQKRTIFLQADITVEAGKSCFGELVPQEGIRFVNEAPAKNTIASLHLTESFLSDLEPTMLFSRLPVLMHGYEKIMVTRPDRSVYFVYLQRRLNGPVDARSTIVR